MDADAKAVAALTILLATCETCLEAFRASARPIDSRLLTELESLIQRVRREIDTLGLDTPAGAEG